MAEHRGGHTPEPKTEDMNWALLLRADLQALRQEFRVDTQELRQGLDGKLQAQRQESRQDMRELRQDFKEHVAETPRLVDSRFRWTIGIMFTLFALHGSLMFQLLGQ